MDLTANIRAGNRYALSAERNQKKTFELDNHRRLLDSTSQEPTNVQVIANKLKTQSSMPLEDMVSLKNLLLTESNIQVFLKTHGALRGLVREFTGLNTTKQTAAAGCLCNLALSEARSSQIVASAAGAYLLPCLRSLSTDLVVVCAWTLGNLAGSHESVCDILTAQGALSTLISILSQTVHEEIREAVLYALIHFVYILKDSLGQDDLAALFEILSGTQRDKSTYHLLFLLSCHPQFLCQQTTTNEFVSTVVDAFSKDDSIEDTASDKTDSEQLIHIVRLLANICAVSSCSNYVLKCWQSPKLFSRVEIMLSSKCEKLHRSMLWLLGNIFNTCSQDGDHLLFFKTISDKV